MHPSSYENMLHCFEHYVRPSSLIKRKTVTVLDLGGKDVNGSYRALFDMQPFQYLVADIDPGPGVNVVLEQPDVLPFLTGGIDIVLCGQMLEHCPHFWKIFAEMVRVVDNSGFIFLIVPSAGPQHRYPVDCYRFFPDAMQALADHAGCRLLEVRHDRRGPWRDVTAVFSKNPLAAAAIVPGPPPDFEVAPGTPEEEATRGREHYLTVLGTLHKQLAPRFYLEIGVRRGNSLALARCPAVGVDPFPEVTAALPESAAVVAKTSDAYFEEAAAARPPLDLAFIDGMHHFENVLRDFMHIEERSHPGTVVAIDDVFPVHPRQARRERSTRVWTGDVWKIIPCLQRHRPDLSLQLLDTAPTGMLLITGLDRTNRTLWDGYNPIVREFGASPSEPDCGILERTGAAPFPAPVLEVLSQRMRRIRDKPQTGATAISARREPELSVVVVAYNMRRELPRTLASLSHALQRDISPDCYEILVMDNGSTQLFDRDACARLGPNIVFCDVPDPTPSPVRAINLGLGLARGDIVGVWIDGARMASPGLLSHALAASRLHERAVVGACAFHLGYRMQVQNVKAGYDQAAEDALLAGCAWEEDPYRLFTVSCFAASASTGWFELPFETNSLFLRRGMWKELGGYDPAFDSPGGGLCNLDIWKRALDLPGAVSVMALGEGTFHQVHGGVATNGEGATPEMYAEYRRIRGCDFTVPVGPPPLQYGRLHPLARWTLHAQTAAAAL